jgi:ATP-dependent DNA helicase RecG
MTATTVAVGGADAAASSLPGAGPKTAARLAAVGIGSVRDLLMRLPRGYDDLRAATAIAELPARADGDVVLVRGIVRRVHVFPRRFLDVVIGDGVGPEGVAIRARWFRARAAMAKRFVKGEGVAVAGPLRTAADGTRELIHPRVVPADVTGLGIRPRYAAVEGVPGKVFERMIEAALGRVAAGVEEVLPAATRRRLRLPSLGEALGRVHAPADLRDADGALAAAHRRIALETLLVGQVAFLWRRAELGPAAVRVDARTGAAARARLEVALPWPLTPSQARALDDIAASLAAPQAMQRLLVGDVGSGKTAVALASAAAVAAAGGGTLMMVPTEVLAEQQLRALAPVAARLGLRMAALTGATRGAARDAILRDAAGGRLDMLIGTQALLAPNVGMPRVGLVVVDEQHRFGVEARAAVGRRAGAGTPHLLAMSATPIPRTVALLRHGDLDASFLTERPAGRAAPAAVACTRPGEREAAYARLREAVAAGQQAFVVCPVRERGKRPGAVTAVAHHARLVRALAPARVGLLHGALAAAAKEDVLRRFAAGALDVLVATTIVELGIDVPAATVMIVEDAERFGLAQLHQLRGRVGRGAAAGICFLCTENDAGAGAERLELVSRVDDGFRLAEADLAARGFGELLGTAQSGQARELGVGDLAQLGELAAIARAEAEVLWRSDPGLTSPAHRELARAVRARVGRTFAGDAG